jgi:lysophospholipase L1-like esterase
MTRSPRRLRMLTAGAALAAAQVLGLVAGAAPAQAAGGSTSCTEGGVTWRADYTVADSVFGPLLTVTGLKRIDGAGQTDASGMTWELRYDNTPGEFPPQAAAGPPPFHAVRGPLSTIAGTPVATYLSPRLVTPDGACTVYAAPFGNHTSGPGWPRVAVLGDSLLQQLNDSNFNQSAIQGYLEGNLNSIGVLTEVEGQGGRRWTDDGSTGLAKADSYLLDEYRGLLEHDPDGFVVALGANDALFVATGASQADRDSRLSQVQTKLRQVLGEMRSRAGCLVAITAPEHPNVYSANYAAAAKSINDTVRAAAAESTTDSLELVDFADQARTHRNTDPAPWFGGDNLHLAGAGLLVYTATIVQAARRCTDSVVLHGAAGTFDPNSPSGRVQLATGQRALTRTVSGWGFEPGRAPWFSTVTADGTLFFMTVGSAGNVFVSSGEGMSLGAFDPNAGSFSNIRLKTDRNKEVPVKPCAAPPSEPWCQDTGVDRLAGDVGDVDVLNGGNAVVFTGLTLYGGQNLDTEGQFPMFGIVTKGTDGHWRVAEGPDANADGRPDWRNAWSPRELVDATVAADPVHGPALSDAVCPIRRDFFGQPVLDPGGHQVRDCVWTNEVAVLPRSNAVVLTHYGLGTVSVLDVQGPDASGRYSVHISGDHRLPEIDDPSWPDGFSEPSPYLKKDEGPCDGDAPPAEADRKIGVAPREVQADPTSVLGDERFVLGSDMGAWRYADQAGCVANQVVAGGIIEFRYDASAPWDQRVKPVSAPVLVDEVTTKPEPVSGLRAFAGMGPMRYDHQGNLWVPTGDDNWGGLGVKVYPKTASGRALSSSACFDPAKPIQDYVAETAGARKMWGIVCRPQYNVLQPKILGPVFHLDEDPATGNIVVTSWPHGTTVVVDPEGSGTSMTFRVSDVAALSVMATTTQQVEGPCAANPAQRCTAGPKIQAMQGPVDAAGRVWVVASQGTPNTIDSNSPELATRAFAQWVSSVELSRLLGREPQRLTARSGQATVVQAEQTRTMTTTQAPGRSAAVAVDSVASVGSCFPSTCTDPVSGLDGGYALGNETGGGIPAGTVAEYRLVVPKAGRYRVTYRAADRDGGGPAQIRLTVNGNSFDTTVSNATLPAAGQEVGGPTLDLPAGTVTVQLSAPTAAAAGWQLDWMRFARS